ncbi:MAG: hypothetical protein KAI83_17140 [Thiomargarita sp.]|nr:hypothetical protein [Thiomargarita sp.]
MALMLGRTRRFAPTVKEFIGVQRFSFGRLLEFNALALGVFWSPNL